MTIKTLLNSVPGVKKDWKEDWKENTKEDWKYDWDAAAGPIMPPPVNTVSPAISGAVLGLWRVGNTLTASRGTWTGQGITYAYQWLLDGAAISGAIGPTYVPVAGDVGKQVKIRVTATNGGGTASATDLGVAISA